MRRLRLTRTLRSRRVQQWAAAALAATVLGACVEESSSRRSNTVGSKPAPTSAAALPDGPIASPALNATRTISRVVVNIAPLGAVPYDGLVLPQLSPDGRFIAVEEGEPPGWPSLLAEDDAVPALATRIAVYDLAGTPPTRVPSNEPMPPGALLGRATDAVGYLIEWPRPDGSRWIGRVHWVGGRVEWLVQGQAVNAHAVYTPRGGLLYTRRAPGAANAELVLAAEGQESVRSDPAGSYCFPVTTADVAVAYTLVRTATGIDLEAVGVDTRGRLAGTLSRERLANNIDPIAAYQIAQPTQPSLGPMAASTMSLGSLATALVIYHPGLGRMTQFDVRSGGFLPLAQGSVSAVAWDTGAERGYLCTTPEGVMFMPPPLATTGAAAKAPPAPARVIPDTAVPRRTINPQRPIVLFAPTPRDPTRLSIWLLAPMSPADSDKPADAGAK